MSQRSDNRNNPIAGIEPSQREHLHAQLDKLLDARQTIAQASNGLQMTDDIANALHAQAERLMYQACGLASDAAGPNVRAIAFRHPNPNSREALAIFLKCVAEMAAPYVYSTNDLGIETFTWTDVMAVVDDLTSLDHGDVPNRLAPSAKARRRSTAYPLLKEQWRAVKWVAYFTEFEGRPSKESAVSYVAQAYGVTERTVYNWENDTTRLLPAPFRDWELDDARQDGRLNQRPDFTLAPANPGKKFDAIACLNFDGIQFKNIKSNT